MDPVEVFTDLLDAHARQRGAEHICQLVILDNTAHRMRYKHFRDLGLFVGSGVVEAGCKAVIGQRLKLSGMHWSARGATVITTLRCHHAIAPSTHASAA